MSEFIYTIDKERSEQDGALAIKIQAAQRAGLALVPIDKAPPLTKAYLTKLMTARDAALLNFLMKEEAAYVKKTSRRPLDQNSATFDIVHLLPGALPEAFKLFVITGKLFFNGKQLAVDLFGKAEFYYTTNPQAPAEAEGRIKISADDFPITACDQIIRGSPHWFIKGVRLMSIATDVSWKDLQAAFAGAPRPLRALIEDAADDPEAPRVIAVKELPQAARQPEPLPVLVLKDRLGAFADLWMDYEGELHPFGDAKGATRQPAAEQAWEKDLLETDYIRKRVGTSHYYCPLDKVAKSLSFLLEIGWQVRDWRGNAVHLHARTELAAETGERQDIVIKGKLHYGEHAANLADIIGAFNRRERFAQIAAGHVALLPPNLEQIGLDGIADEGEIAGDAIRVKQARLGALAAFFDNQPQARLSAPLADLKERLADFNGIQHAPPSAAFAGTLRTYQQKGVDWLAFLHTYGFHGMLADDMGLGKTVQVLAFLSTLTLEAPCLIVVPTSLIFNWKREIERFLPSVPCLVHHGNTRVRSAELLDRPQIVLTTYATLRLDLALLAQPHYDCLILDEAQAIKNSHTQTFQAATTLAARFRLSITGTPIENHLNELWAHFRFLLPDLFGDEEAFQAELLAGASDARYLKRIKKKIAPFLLRRRKEEVAQDLPEKIEQVVWVEMGEAQRTAYEAFLSGARRRFVDDSGVAHGRMEILEAIMRLRQLCCHPLLVTAAADSACAESAKLEALLQDVETALEERRKVLIYSQFTSMLALIGQRLKEKGWRYAYLDGTTQNREKVVSQFQDDDAVPLFLISLKAGGVGLNLTAADYVFLYDPWWNDAAENQAIDRAHRIGRKDTVIAKRYVMAESIEERMMKLKASKSSLAADLLDDDTAAQSLSVDDLLFLLS